MPLRYVHGVGVVPISSMPFADKVFEANASDMRGGQGIVRD